MTKQYFMKPSKGMGCAIFEIEGDKAIVSATVGIIDMIYKSEQSVEQTRILWTNLKKRGFEFISNQEANKLGFSYNYVWEFYN